jgi:hypothetical protein
VNVEQAFQTVAKAALEESLKEELEPAIIPNLIKAGTPGTKEQGCGC